MIPGEKSKHGFAPISPLSAALTILEWSKIQGRMPKASELHLGYSSGLLFTRKTYMRAFRVSSHQQLISAVIDLTSGLTWYTCLRLECSNRFPKEDAGIRFCPACRKKPRPSDDTGLGYGSVSRTQLRRWGADLGDWSEYMDWSEE